LASYVDVEPNRQSHGARWFPLLRVTDEWASVRVLNYGTSQNRYRAALFIDPAH
jgi:hypothetical protein